MARSLLSRMCGRVFGWFESKEARPYSRPLPAKFSTRARLVLSNLEDRVVPATITVTSLADSGPGSLRQAILDANADTADDVITFDATLFSGGPKTINLLTPLPTFVGTPSAAIPVSVKLIGPGEDLLTVQRAPGAATSFGIISFSNLNNSQNFVEVSKITFAGGTTGNAVSFGNEIATMDRVVVRDSAILTSTGIIISTVSGVPGKLTMINSRLTGNLSTVQGGLYVGPNATAIIQNSVISGNTGIGPGGGIRLATNANLTVTDSVISNNRSSSNGGGVYFFNGGSMLMERSTVSGNFSIEQTGGVYFYGAISGQFRILNSTIANNISRRAGGGVGFLNHVGTAEIFNSTITGNTSRDFATGGGGGVAIMGGTGTVDIQSSIVSGNFAPNLPVSQSDLRNNGGTMTVDYCAIGVDPGFALGPNNIPFGSFLDLGPLTVNVPGKTPTFAIGAASAALNKGSTAISGTTEDQNGTTRPNGIAPDIGAFERIEEDPDASYTGTTSITLPTPGPDFFFEVTYDNNTADIDTATIGNDDIRIVRISGPTGFTPFNVLAKFIDFVPPGPTPPGKPITAKYSFNVPGGSWDAADNGVYRFVVEPNSVKSTAGKSSPNVAIADLTVGISQNFVVTTLADSGPGSLRQVLNDVNVVPSNDTVTFDPALFTGGMEFINLVSPLPVVNDSVSIVGPGSSKLTIRRELGSPLNFGILSFINGAVQTKVSVSGLTITRGQVAMDGAGIFAGDEDVTINDVVLTGNSGRLGGGIMSLNGKLTILNSTLSNNTASSTGGALFNGQSELRIENSTISGNTNQAANRGGGGIMLFGNLPPIPGGGVNIINTTISGNTANFSGGGIEIFYSSGTINIRNSTITLNQANLSSASAAPGKFGGGIAIELASAVVGGVTVNLDSTIVSGNKLGDPAAPANTKDIANVGTNVTLNITKSAIGVDPAPQPYNPSGNLPFGIDLKMGALASNGGLTKTHALAFDSPAIDKGSDINVPPLSFDQRGTGFPRNKFSGVDIGAFEYQGDVPSAAPGTFPNVTVESPSTNPYVFTVTYNSSITKVSVASLDSNDIRVTGPGGFNTLATFVSSSPATDANSVVATYKFTAPGGSWDGNDNGTYTISVEPGQVSNTAGNFVPAGAVGTFNAVLPITRLVTNNNDSGPGSLRQAILDTNANPAADFIVFDKSLGFFDGTPAKSVITAALGPMLILDNVTITGPGAKFATVSGGNNNRMLVINGPGQLEVTISELRFADGKVSDLSDGGAISIANEKVVLSKVEMENNETNGGGGAVLIGAGGVLTVQDSTLSNNKATGDDGGAIIVGTGARLVITNSTLSGNTAEDDGGAIYFYNGGSFLLDRSTISGNLAKGNVDGKGGGGIYFFGAVNSDDFIVVNSTISGNSSTFNLGGGISFVDVPTVAGDKEVIIRNSTITENFGQNGAGGIAMSGTNMGNIDVISTIISGNKTSLSPGASDDVFNLAPSATMNYSFSAIGQDPLFGLTDLGNNLTFGANLDLGPLAFNLGGTTKTHLPGPASAALNAGTNPAPAQAKDQNGNARLFGPAVDIGSVEVQPVIPSVSSIQVNDGNPQRSRLTSITITFTGTVTPAAFSALGDITLTRTAATNPALIGTVVQTGATGANGLITVTQPGPTNQLRLTFSNANGASETAGVEFASLADGRWQLAVVPSSFLSTLNDPNLRRLFGDFEIGPPTPSNGTVDSSDFGAFGSVFGTSPGVGVSPFDYDNNGTLDAIDFAAFGARFGLSV